jgi:SAF domain
VRAALVISDRDNVATALEPLEPGRPLDIAGVSITIAERIESGHKVALRPIAAGQPVIKYGSPIGVASAAIAPGEHVHTHNLSSSRGRGDLESPQTATEPRLAEPPDEPTATRPNA